MDLDSKTNRLRFIALFPDLAQDENFRLESEATDIYNCIAWAMGYDDRWIAPIEAPGYWWPEGVEKNFMPNTLIDAFIKEGFEICHTYDLEKGYDKVALYKRSILYKGMPLEIWSHASRIVAEGIEHCKFGQDCDGRHSLGMVEKTAAGLEELGYGRIFCIMKRPVGVPKEEPHGEIEIDLSALR